MKHLYFIRHGESELNVRRIFAGQMDTPLTQLGREQAKSARIQAKQLSIDLIVASPLSRALETAQIVAAGIGYPVKDILVNDLFMERSLGSLEGKSWDEFLEPHGGTDSQQDYGAETDEQLLQRARRGLEFLRSLEAETILLVSHGSFSIALRTAIDPSQTYDEPENAQILQLV